MKSYEELVEEIEKHHNPIPSKVQVFKKESKSIATYLSELCSIAQDCNFCDNLDNMLQDCLVCGMENKSILRNIYWWSQS